MDRRSLLAAPLPWAVSRPAAAQAAVVDVHIDMRDEIAAGRFDPARNGVGLRGAVRPLSWGQTLPAQPLAYKFKIDRPGRPDDGWEPGRNRAICVTTAALRVERAFGTDPGAPPPVRTGHIERIAPQGSRFVSPREVQVWLPPGYADEPARRYPVLLLHDGQNLFDHLDAGAEWQVDEAAERGVRSGELAPMIIVGVASNGDRTLDCTPVPMPLEGRTQGGGAARYARYLVEELQPLLHRRYRTRRGALGRGRVIVRRPGDDVAAAAPPRGLRRRAGGVAISVVGRRRDPAPGGGPRTRARPAPAVRHGRRRRPAGRARRTRPARRAGPAGLARAVHRGAGRRP